MKRVRNLVVLAAIAGVGVIAPLLAADDRPSASSATPQVPPAAGPRGASPPNQETQEWRSDFDSRSAPPDYSQWETAPSGDWGEPVYGGWSAEPSEPAWEGEPSGQGWGRGPAARPDDGPPSGVSPERPGAEQPAASSLGRPRVDPWAATEGTTDAQPAGETAAPPQPSSVQAPSATAVPGTYPAVLPPPVAAPAGPYGGYPGYGAAPPPPPPPGWGYGYPGYGGPPGPYGGPGGPQGGQDSGWPWGDMMPWGSRGGGGSPWGNWMPWSK